jgi:hypothetical protein
MSAITPLLSFYEKKGVFVGWNPTKKSRRKEKM